MLYWVFFFFFKQKTAYEIGVRLVGSEMCIRDRDKAECAALCKQYGLIHTGGTDFHGANHKVPHPVGTCTTEEDQIARILELAHQRRGIDV